MAAHESIKVQAITVISYIVEPKESFGKRETKIQMFYLKSRAPKETMNDVHGRTEAAQAFIALSKRFRWTSLQSKQRCNW